MERPRLRAVPLKSPDSLGRRQLHQLWIVEDEQIMFGLQYQGYPAFRVSYLGLGQNPGT